MKLLLNLVLIISIVNCSFKVNKNEEKISKKNTFYLSQENRNLRILQSSTTLITSSDTTTSPTTDTTSIKSLDSTSTNLAGNTSSPIHYSSSGLSTGAMVAILLPCIAVLIAVTIITILIGRKSVVVPPTQNPNLGNNSVVFNSSSNNIK